MTQEKAIPALRFPEFKGEWHQDILSSLSNEKFQNGVFNDPKKVGSGYRIINVKDMYQDGFIDERELPRLELSKSEFDNNKVVSGDTFFTRSSLVKEGIAYSNLYLRDADDVTYDGHLIRLRPDKGIVDPRFLNALLKTYKTRKEIVSHGKTGTMTTIGQSDLSKCVVVYPKLPEQQKIAKFLGAVDEKIAQLQKKKDLLEDYKKGCMQKLFSQEIRFTDNNGNPFPDWEEKRLGDIATFKKGKGISKADISEDGGEKCIRYGELYTEYKAFIASIKSRTNVDMINPVLSKKNDILMPTSDVTPNGLATASAIDEKDVILGGDILIIRAKGLNNRYFSYFVDGNKHMIMRLVSGVTVYHIYGSDMATLKLTLPHIDEQKKIADFLSALDDKIALVADELNKAKTFKKGLLQQMFV